MFKAILGISVVALVFILLVRSRSFRKNHVCIMVLGDVGHSPRMINHASSLLSHNYTIDFIGYPGSSPPAVLMKNPRITFHYLEKPQKIMAIRSNLARAIRGVLRVIRQVSSILWKIAFQLQKPEYLLIQNPPAIPTLFIAQTIRLFLGVKLIIDWHNFGYSLMAMDKSMNQFTLPLLEFYERFFGARAELHLCVTDAMNRHLKENWAINGRALSLFDRPPTHFFEMTAEDSMKVLKDQLLYDKTNQQVIYAPDSENSLLPHFIDTIKNKPFIVTSTSWTEDEDFSILVDALQRYDSHCKTNTSLPPLFILITGKGPLKETYMKQISQLQMKKVSVATAWLKSEDYPRILSLASLGLSFHVSSSGLDLPMKIVDIYGCGIPALSASYACINELVVEGVNGHLFMDGSSLENHLSRLFSGYKNNTSPELTKLKESLILWRPGWGNWRSEWDRVVFSALKN